MRDFLVVIGWKNIYGEWVKKEIALDIVIMLGAVVSAYIVYAVWSVFGA